MIIVILWESYERRRRRLPLDELCISSGLVQQPVYGFVEMTHSMTIDA